MKQESVHPPAKMHKDCPLLSSKGHAQVALCSSTKCLPARESWGRTYGSVAQVGGGVIGRALHALKCSFQVPPIAILRQALHLTQKLLADRHSLQAHSIQHSVILHQQTQVVS